MFEKKKTTIMCYPLLLWRCYNEEGHRFLLYVRKEENKGNAPSSSFCGVVVGLKLVAVCYRRPFFCV
jgi:hypothetical protein